MKLRLLGIIALLWFAFALAIISPMSVQASTDGSVTDWLEQKDDEPKSNNEEESPSDVASSNSSVFFLLLKMIFYTIVVVGLIYILIKFLAKRQRKMQSHSVLNQIGGTSLGNNKSVQIIQLGNTLYMVGVGENINLLKEINDDNEIKTILDSVQMNSTGTQFLTNKSRRIQEKFQESLKRQITKRNDWRKDMNKEEERNDK